MSTAGCHTAFWGSESFPTGPSYREGKAHIVVKRHAGAVREKLDGTFFEFHAAGDFRNDHDLPGQYFPAGAGHGGMRGDQPFQLPDHRTAGISRGGPAVWNPLLPLRAGGGAGLSYLTKFLEKFQCFR